MSRGTGKGWRRTLLMVTSHALSDFYATIFTPLVETFRAGMGLSVVGVSALGALLGIFGSMVQPLMGVWSDRTDRGRLAAAGLLVSAVFFGLIGLAPNVAALALLLTVGATGVAMFHPSAAVLTVRDEGRRNMAMGLFMTGGGVGLALAPWVATRIVGRLGLAWLWLIALPGAGVAAWLYLDTRGDGRGMAAGRWFRWRALFAAGTGAAWALFAMALVRSVAITAFAFYASVLGKERGWGLAGSGDALSWFLGCGVVGSLAGGHLADRTDRRLLMGASCLLAAPLFFVYASTRGVLSVPAFAMAGLVYSVANPVNVAFAQELYPQNASLVSGVMMGMAWGVANLLLMAVGAAAEAWGVGRALQGVSVLAGLAAVFLAFVPARAAGAGG